MGITRRHRWIDKFACALRGVVVGVRGQDSFAVDVPLAAAVVLAAWLLGVTLLEWCALLLCIAAVFAAELFNSALERLAQAITREEDAHIRDALDISSAAVLLVSLAVSVVGVLILGGRLLALMQ